MMKRILPLMGFVLLMYTGFGQAPGSRLPAINPSKANKESKKLPEIRTQKTTVQSSDNTNKPTKNSNKEPKDETDPGCSHEDIYISELNFAIADQLVRTNLSFPGGSRLALALVLKSGDVALLNNLPDLFDKDNYPVAECLGMVDNVEASTPDKKSVPLAMPETFYEYASGFACLKTPLASSGGSSFQLKKPVNKVKTGGYVFWFGRNYAGEFVYPVWEEITFTEDKNYYDLVQPEGDVVAGFFIKEQSMGDTPDILLLGVAQKMQGQWVLAKVSAEPGVSTKGQAVVKPAKTVASGIKSPDTSSGKQQPAGPRSDSRGGQGERGYTDNATNERDFSNNSPDPRSAGGESPRDRDRGMDSPDGRRN